MKRRHCLLALCLAGGCRPAPPASAPSLNVTPWQPPGISGPRFESHPAYDRWNRTLYFVRSSPQFQGWQILMSQCRDGRWSEPQPAPFAAPGAEADPFLSRDGRALYFISSRAENGARQQELDVWMVERATPSAAWGVPVRLGEPISSASNEWFPRPSADGWLYFGSDRPGGLGATDIYRARRERDGWRVENLGPEVNGPGDEYEAEVSPDGRRMLLMADGDLYMLDRVGNRWSRKRKLGPEVNTAGIEVGPAFAPDGRSFLFASDRGTERGSGELMLAGPSGPSWPPLCS